MQDRTLFNAIEKYQSFAPGQTIFQEGEPGDRMYLIAEGQVDILLGGQLLETVESGGILGELALIDNKPRSAMAVARTPCRLAPIDQPHFLSLIQRTPLFAIQVMRVMADRLRRANRQIQS
jgi:CRP/FNR family transcriptional regulator, cyclic AMP receptor protein